MNFDPGFIPKVIILAGGKGTRSENPLIPKILQPISPSETLLDLHIKNLGNFKSIDLTFLLGHLNEQVIERLRTLNKSPNISVNWKIDTPSDNPVTAVTRLIASELNQNQIYILILGDVLVNTDLMRYSLELSKSSFKGFVLVHPNLHPLESDVFEFDIDNKAKKLALKGELSSNTRPTRAIAGVYLFKGSALEMFNTNESELTTGIIAPLFSAGELNVINSVEYFQDTGTKSRLLKAQNDFQSGAFHKRGEIPKKAIFLEFEEMLIKEPNRGSNKDIVIQSPSEISTAISKANSKGIPIVLFSLLKKETSLSEQAQVLSIVSQVESELRDLNAIVDDFIFVQESNRSQTAESNCFHPEVLGDCNICGPALIEITRRHSIDQQNSILLGGSEGLLEISTAIGMQFKKTRDKNNTLEDLGKLVNDAITRILK